MTNYREILRLHSLGLNKTEIASSCRCARNRSEEHTSELQSLRLISYAVSLMEEHTSELQSLRLISYAVSLIGRAHV